MEGMVPSFSDWLGAGGHPQRNEARAKPPRVVLVLGGGKEAGDMGYGTEGHGLGHPALWESWDPKVLGTELKGEMGPSYTLPTTRC